MKRWFLAGGTIAVVLMLATFNPNMSVIDNNLDITKSNDKASSDSIFSHEHNHDHDAHNPNNQTKKNVHYEQLSPEVKQALKNSLLLENDTETFTKDDGTVVLPVNGRATQVTVAVQMPDGSIQIKEYSNIPKPNIEFTKDIEK